MRRLPKKVVLKIEKKNFRYLLFALLFICVSLLTYYKILGGFGICPDTNAGSFPSTNTTQEEEGAGGNAQKKPDSIVDGKRLSQTLSLAPELEYEEEKAAISQMEKSEIASIFEVQTWLQRTLPSPKKEENARAAKETLLKLQEGPSLILIINGVGISKARLNQFFSNTNVAALVVTQNIEDLPAGAARILALPMEAKSQKNKDVLFFKGMSLTQIDALINTHTRSGSVAMGISNLMGSAFSEDFVSMLRLFSVLKKWDLPFVDAFTTPKSVSSYASAALDFPVVLPEYFIRSKAQLAFMPKAIENHFRKSQKGAVLWVEGAYIIRKDFVSWIHKMKSEGVTFISFS